MTKLVNYGLVGIGVVFAATLALPGQAVAAEKAGCAKKVIFMVGKSCRGSLNGLGSATIGR